MNCEKCGREGADFMGRSKSYPDPIDCSNTPDNLPGGFAWLCPDCLDQVLDQDFSGLDQNSHPRKE